MRAMSCGNLATQPSCFVVLPCHASGWPFVRALSPFLLAPPSALRVPAPCNVSFLQAPFLLQFTLLFSHLTPGSVPNEREICREVQDSLQPTRVPIYEVGEYRAAYYDCHHVMMATCLLVTCCGDAVTVRELIARYLSPHVPVKQSSQARASSCFYLRNLLHGVVG